MLNLYLGRNVPNGTPAWHVQLSVTVTAKCGSLVLQSSVGGLVGPTVGSHRAGKSDTPQQGVGRVALTKQRHIDKHMLTLCTVYA
jgi:hypothetical protein